MDVISQSMRLAFWVMHIFTATSGKLPSRRVVVFESKGFQELQAFQEFQVFQEIATCLKSILRDFKR